MPKEKSRNAVAGVDTEWLILSARTFVFRATSATFVAKIRDFLLVIEKILLALEKIFIKTQHITTGARVFSSRHSVPNNSSLSLFFSSFSCFFSCLRRWSRLFSGISRFYVWQILYFNEYTSHLMRKRMMRRIFHTEAQRHEGQFSLCLRTSVWNHGRKDIVQYFSNIFIDTCIVVAKGLS